MKKQQIIILITTILLVSVGLFSFLILKKDIISKDEIKFKKEYEELNKDNKKLNIPLNNKMEYVDLNEVIDIINKEEAIIYFGFASCPWCRNAVNPLIDAIHTTELKKVYYFNDYNVRNKMELVDGQVIIKEEGTEPENYKKLLNLLGNFASSYEGLEDETIKRLYFPTVIGVKNGKVINFHEGTYEDHDPKNDLSDKQYNELKQRYIDMIEEIKNTSCNSIEEEPGC